MLLGAGHAKAKLAVNSSAIVITANTLAAVLDFKTDVVKRE